MKLASFLALWVMAAFAQTPQTFEIRGKVVEMGGGIIPEADIEITTFDEPIKTIRTDVSGAFRIAVTRPGLYSLLLLGKTAISHPPLRALFRWSW